MNELIYIGEMLRLVGDTADADTAALKAAQAKNADADAKLLTYARCHSLAGAYRAVLCKALTGLKWALYFAAALAALTGFFAGFSAFQQTPTGGQVNVFWLLATLLGVHFLSLLLWAAFIWRSPSASFSLLTLLNRAIAWAARKQPQHALAARAIAGVQLTGALGRASISVFSHGFWFVYLLAGFAASVILLSVQSYQFMWETTLLQPQTAVSIFTIIGKPLALMGFQVPNASIITAAENLGNAGQSKQQAALWARFCLTALIVYGVVPRLILVALCAVWRSRLVSAARLNASDPFFASLLAQIYQPTAAIEVVDADDAGRAETDVPTAPVAAGYSPAAMGSVIGWEVDALDHAVFEGGTIIGVYEDSPALNAAVTSLNGAAVTLAVSLLNTPDRGVESALKAIAALPVDQRSVVLLNVEALQDRSSAADAKRRIGDWWSLLIRLGFAQSSITIVGAQSA